MHKLRIKFTQSITTCICSKNRTTFIIIEIQSHAHGDFFVLFDIRCEWPSSTLCIFAD